MKDDHTPLRSTDELIANAVRLGREFEMSARASWLGGRQCTSGFLKRAFQHLTDREPFDPRDDGAFEALGRIIEDDLEAEVEGIERRRVETHYDADGQHYEMRDVAVYSSRGVELQAAQRAFQTFIAARARALDRITADRLLIRLLAEEGSPSGRR